MLEQEVRMKDGSQAIVNSLGDIAMAGSAASGKISILVYAIPNSIYAGCVSMAGQCYGAKEYKRIDELWIKSIAVSAGITAPRLLLNFFIFQLNPNLFWLHICIPISYVFCMVAQVIYYRHCRKIVNNRISAA